jgi:hypothetical protein
MKRALLPAIVLSLALPALGQREAPKRPDVTVLDFDLDVIEGTLDRPDLELQTAARKRTHPSVVKIREHFRARVLGSIAGL